MPEGLPKWGNSNSSQPKEASIYHTTNAYKSKSTDSKLEAIELYFEMAFLYDRYRYYEETLDQTVGERMYPTLNPGDRGPRPRPSQRHPKPR
jgi:hypothetical protein